MGKDGSHTKKGRNLSFQALFAAVCLSSHFLAVSTIFLCTGLVNCLEILFLEPRLCKICTAHLWLHLYLGKWNFLTLWLYTNPPLLVILTSDQIKPSFESSIQIIHFNGINVNWMKMFCCKFCNLCNFANFLECAFWQFDQMWALGRGMDAAFVWLHAYIWSIARYCPLNF